MSLSETPTPNCSRRAGCRLAWLMPSSVCDYVHEWVNVRQYCKAFWIKALYKCRPIALPCTVHHINLLCPLLTFFRYLQTTMQSMLSIRVATCSTVMLTWTKPSISTHWSLQGPCNTTTVSHSTPVDLVEALPHRHRRLGNPEVGSGSVCDFCVKLQVPQIWGMQKAYNAGLIM